MGLNRSGPCLAEPEPSTVALVPTRRFMACQCQFPTLLLLAIAEPPLTCGLPSRGQPKMMQRGQNNDRRRRRCQLTTTGTGAVTLDKPNRPNTGFRA